MLKSDFAFANRTKNGVHRSSFVLTLTTKTSTAPPEFGTTADTADAVKPPVADAPMTRESMMPDPTRRSVLFFFSSSSRWYHHRWSSRRRDEDAGFFCREDDWSERKSSLLLKKGPKTFRLRCHSTTTQIIMY